jgi:hypothetical protein
MRVEVIFIQPIFTQLQTLEKMTEVREEESPGSPSSRVIAKARPGDSRRSKQINADRRRKNQNAVPQRMIPSLSGSRTMLDGMKDKPSK